LISAAIALVTFVFQQRTGKKKITVLIQNALSSGGLIILITSAGGAFGGISETYGG